MFTNSGKLIVVLTAIGVSACANSSARYEPIVDGAKDEKFYTDLGSCQKLAEEREFINGDTRSEAIKGAVIGGVVGAIGDGAEGAAGGAAAGAVIAGGEQAWEARYERKQIVINCMAGRGYRVVG